MNLEQSKELLSKEVKALIKKNGSMKFLEFTFALVGLFRSKPDTLKASEIIEREIGEDAANEWLCGIMAETKSYSTDMEYVSVSVL